MSWSLWKRYSWVLSRLGKCGKRFFWFLKWEQFKNNVRTITNNCLEARIIRKHSKADVNSIQNCQGYQESDNTTLEKKIQWIFHVKIWIKIQGQDTYHEYEYAIGAEYLVVVLIAPHVFHEIWLLSKLLLALVGSPRVLGQVGLVVLKALDIPVERQPMVLSPPHFAKHGSWQNKMSREVFLIIYLLLKKNRPHIHIMTA